MANSIDKVTSPMAQPPSDRLADWLAQHGPALRRYFARRVGAENADDLVQEVFLRLQVSATDAEHGNVERLLFTVAKHVLINRHRTDVRRHAAFHDDFEEALDLPDDISPERILSAKQEYARALVAILELPPRMRTALMLHRFARLSMSTIAKRMGIKRATVQTLIERSVSRVARNLEDEQ